MGIVEVVFFSVVVCEVFEILDCLFGILIFIGIMMVGKYGFWLEIVGKSLFLRGEDLFWSGFEKYLVLILVVYIVC